MNALHIARVALRRFARDRTAMVFVVVLPVVVIVVVGATVRGFSDFRIAVVDRDGGPQAVRIVTALERTSGLQVKRFASVDAARVSVRRAETSLAVVVPPAFSSRLTAGATVRVDVLGDQTSSNYEAAVSAVTSTVDRVAGHFQAAGFASAETGQSYRASLARSDAAASAASPIAVTATDIDSARHTLPEGFSYSAPTMLVLFVFINALAGGAGIIESRRLGVYQRMSAGPVRRSSIIGGETLAALTVALGQSALILLIGSVAFGVSWGDPLAALALVVVWALVGTGAGMLSGTLFRTPEQASSVGPALGIALGMLGGCMWPLEIVAPVMRTVGHIAPQAWAVDAWTAVLSRGAGLTGIASELGVLAAMAAGLLAVSTYRLRGRLV